MIFSVRDIDVLRLLCWCQNIRPDDLNFASTETERGNLAFLALIKRHERSGTLTITAYGKTLLHTILEGTVPDQTFSYRQDIIQRRVRLSLLLMTAYRAGINVFTTTANSLSGQDAFFLTAVTRNRGHNPWGSARVGAIAHLGGVYYAAHYVCPDIGRMAVNDEIGELERFLDAILGRLKPGGRVAVISFHSLEDRVVKHRMKAWAQGCICPKHIPVCVCHHVPEALLVTPKPVCPSERELMLNPRAGSAKLRVAEKLDPHARQADEESGEEAARLRYEAKRAARLARHGREGRERA